MKIFSIKRALGLAAIYGVVQYARKNGGFAPMIEGLKTKVNELKDQATQTLSQVTNQTANTDTNTTTRSTAPVTSSYGESGYGGSYSGGYGSGGFGGGTNRH